MNKRTIKLTNLKNKALDWAVAICDGYESLSNETPYSFKKNGQVFSLQELNFHENWVLVGPLFEREKIHLSHMDGPGIFNGEPQEGDRWLARYNHSLNEIGTTPIEAILRAFVSQQFELEIPIPIELI